MATRVTTRTIDDTDGSEPAHLHRFGLDGREYEIDLSEPNAARLAAIFEPLIRAGRKR